MVFFCVFVVSFSGKQFDMILMLPQCMGIRWTMENSSRGIYCRQVLEYNNI
jgi:hypothetical protein